MVLVRRAIDQDVHLFDRTRLQATSERDLFASHLLPSRTPSNVYRRDCARSAADHRRHRGRRRPAVSAGGGTGPHRRTARDCHGSATASRTGEIERQSDELDRRVLSVSVLFVLLGAGFGYWIAERIADPVNRLTRATRRIARGDLDARIATSSSDELRGLVEDFNQMADDLKRQRDRPRTHAAARGLGRHGPPGGARHQESVDADSAVGRTRATRQPGSRRAAVAGARRLRQRHPLAGPAVAADLRRVLQLRVISHAAAGADQSSRAHRGGGRAIPDRPRRTHCRSTSKWPPICRRSSSIGPCSRAR